MAKIEKAIWQGRGAPRQVSLPLLFGGLINKITLSPVHSSVYKQVSGLLGQRNSIVCLWGSGSGQPETSSWKGQRRLLALTLRRAEGFWKSWHFGRQGIVQRPGPSGMGLNRPRPKFGLQHLLG